MVIPDKDTMERVEQMDLYQEKMELRYHSVDEAKHPPLRRHPLCQRFFCFI